MAPPVRVDLVDPSAFTPPYDRALAAALARAGHDVRLVTSRFAYGDVPAAEGYAVDERFYRRAGRVGAAGLACADGRQARRARARHGGLPRARRRARRRRALPVADRPAARRPPAAALRARPS